jgi:hypothetical protein
MTKRAVVYLIGAVVAASHASARDDGRYADMAPDLKAWFEQLASGRGLCCSFADGSSVADVDWQAQCVEGDHQEMAAHPERFCRYRVRLNQQWIDVPEVAIVQGPNKFGPPVVWPYTDAAGETQIRCFLPGAGA